jgi:endonuclease/exonuclease/phosphatase (EEP) superfamily protein YafD
MSTDAVPTSKPPRLRSIVRRLTAHVARIVSAVVIATLGFSYALPQRLNDAGHTYARLVTVAYFGRTFTFHAGLVLFAVAAVASCLRRRCLTLVTIAVAGTAVWPTVRACLPRHPPPAVGRSVRVMAMNTKYSNRDAADILTQVRRFNPDVLTVEEFAPLVRKTLDDAFGGDYPHRCLRLNGAVALAVYSRLPFDGTPVSQTFGVRRQIRAVVRVGGRPVALYVLHPLSPRSVQRVVWNRQSTADVIDQLRREPLPAVLAGDFNFTAETPNAAALTAAGLTDAFDLAGWGRGSTWPVRPRWTAWLPGVRIDHVYLSPGLTCTRYATGGYIGSDHLPIVADVAIAAPR